MGVLPHNSGLKMAKKVSKKVLKSRYYKFPSLIERKSWSDKIPKYVNFGFKPINILSSSLKGTHTLTEINRANNLHNWNIVLSNKLYKLHETELFLKTHFERGIKENILASNQRELVDHVMFNYFTEIYYYFFFSTIETLAQIINEYYHLKIPENKVAFNYTLIKNTEIQKISEHLLVFNNSVEVARQYRNSFTHKFPKNEKDYRTSLSNENGLTKLSAGRGDNISNQYFLKNVTQCSEKLKVLLDKLKLELNE